MAKTSMTPKDWIPRGLETYTQDLLREMVAVFCQALMHADLESFCGAPDGARSPERVNQRNGYRPRTRDTRVGRLELAMPELREGSYFRGWPIGPRRGADRALVSVVAECYVRGVSTGRLGGLVQTLGIERWSKSQVSEMAKSLDELVEDLRHRPLAGAYPFIWLDVLVLKSGEGVRMGFTPSSMPSTTAPSRAPRTSCWAIRRLRRASLSSRRP